MILIFFITFFYLALIIIFIIGFNKVESFKANSFPAKNSFSIVIPFRNEEHNLPCVLKSISLLNYPTDLFEVFLVNDDSTDDFISIITAFNLENPQLKLILINNHKQTKSPKKDAINSAIKTACHDWIITTDADCEVPKNWLLNFNQFIEEKKPLFISAPVKFKVETGFLFHFQNFNFKSLIGSTIGGFGIKKPFMCNGANLCYHKNTFTLLKGFEGNSTYASGDDIFLLEKFYKFYPDKVKFLKSNKAIVETKSERSWNSFLNQQLRWASKSTAYKNNFSKLVALIVLFENFLLILLMILSITTNFKWQYLLSVFLLKIVVDYFLINKTGAFLNNKNSLPTYFFSSILYPFFVVFIGVLSFFKNYKWKGRSFKK